MCCLLYSLVHDVWGTVEVTAQGVQTEGQEFNLTCVVTTVGGLPQDNVFVSWLDSNGAAVYDDDIADFIVNSTTVSTTSVLVFKDLKSSQGGIYTCEASVDVPGLNIPPPLVEEYDLIVTSK